MICFSFVQSFGGDFSSVRLTRHLNEWVRLCVCWLLSYPIALRLFNYVPIHFVHTKSFKSIYYSQMHDSCARARSTLIQIICDAAKLDFGFLCRWIRNALK